MFKYDLNCIPTPPESTDFGPFGSLRSDFSETPDTFTLIPRLLPIRDQGSRGSCVAHSIALMKEEQDTSQGYFSTDFIYNARSNRPESGMYIRDGLQILKDQGILPERSIWEGQFDFPLTTRLQKKAYSNRISGFARLETMENVKISLLENGPCPIAFPVYQLNGKIWDQKNSESLLGYHAMTVVGWNLEGFVIRNSWGPGWGCDGYITYPYEDWGQHCEVWTSYKLKTCKSQGWNCFRL